MTSTSCRLEKNYERPPLRMAAIVGAYAIFVGATTLAGWLLKLPRLTDWCNNGIAMFPNTAIAALSCGVALILLYRGYKRLAVAIGAVAGAVGAATLFEHVSGINLHIDQLLFNPTWGQRGTWVIGRMGVPMSVSFLVFGIVLWLATLGSVARKMASGGGLLVIALSVLAITGYFFGVDTLYSVPALTAISLPSATILLALGIGILSTVPETEPLRTMLEKSAAGTLVRRALPLTILLPLLVGFLCLKAQTAGLFDSAFEDAIIVLVLVILLSCLLFWSASSVRTHEDALAVNARFSRSIVESSRDCIKTLNLDGTILWINETGLKVLGLTSPNSLMGRAWCDFWSAEDCAAAREAIDAACRGGTGTFVGSLMLQGKQRWWEVNITPIIGVAGDPEKLLAVSRDITERKQSEEARLRLAAVVESSEDAIVSKTLGGIIRTWNPAAERMFGFTAAEAINHPVSILFPPDRLKEEDEIIGRLQRGDRVEHFETVRLRKDGTPLDVSLSISPIKDDRGNIIGASKIARDITQQKKAAKALEEEARNLEILNDTGKAIASNLELESLVQTVTDAGTRLSGAKFGAFFYNVVNENGEEFLLYTLSGAAREDFEKFGLPRNTPVFDPTFRGQGPVRSPDITQDPRYGTMAPHHGMPKGHLPVRSYLAVPVVSRSGEVIGGLFFGHSEVNVFTERAERLMVGIAAQAANAIDNARLYDARKKEIEQRTLAEKKLQLAKNEADRANRAKDEFLAIVSHELRTPLTSILGWTRMLMTADLDEATATHAIQVIERNVKIQTQLIEDLLDVSRVITGKLALTIGPVDLVKVMFAAIESIKPAADAKQIRLDPISEGHISRIAGDAGRLQQIFWNLLSNAVKFTPKGGRVEIRIQQIETAVRITIKDSGRGIDSDFLPYLFERFQQSDSTTTRVYGGLGLGLAIVRHLVEQHGGQVSAASDGRDKGSMFTVELPIRAIMQTDDPVADSSPKRELPARPLTGVRALVVEDEKDSRELILAVLTRAGASGVGVSSVDEAFSEIDRRVPDAIVSDIGMPFKDGYEFVRELKARNGHGNVPMLALTAYAREEDRLQAIAAGFDMHVAKPIDPGELVRRVAALVGR